MRAFYEDVWADAPADPEPWAWERRRALLLGEARPGERVLDLGCGAGRFVAALRAAGCDPVGVEVASAALERARAVAPGADLRLLAEDGSIPLEHRSVDLVWCSEVLEHVADGAHLLQEARRVLRPDGRLLLTVPYHGRVQAAVVALTRFVTWLSNRSEAVEVYLEGQPCCVVADGELDLDALDGERFSREELFMLLREKGVRQLGQVQRAYLEASGAVSAFRAPDESCKPGLPILPPYDDWTPPPGWTVRGAARTAGAAYACWKCGHTEAALAEAEMQACSRCKSDAWAMATRDPLA